MWARDGGACGRHAADKRIHPDCDSDCPGHRAHIQVKQTSRTRDPTRDEIIKHLPSEQAMAELARLGLIPASAVGDGDEPMSDSAEYVLFLLNLMRLL